MHIRESGRKVDSRITIGPSLRVIGVIDLLAGRAVHARAGDRAKYGPVRAVGGSAIEPGDALALARGYVERLELGDLYLADLDAILGGAPQQTLVGRLAALGSPIWLDAGISSVDQARDAIDLGVARVVVGLETLSSFDALARICAALGGERVAFSLDLRDGVPMRSLEDDLSPRGAAARAADAGAGAVIVLDIARVGTGSGPDFDLIMRIRRAVPGLMLLAGGGVRGFDDLERLSECGCDGTLVATALHDGRLGVRELKMASQLDYRTASR